MKKTIAILTLVMIVLLHHAGCANDPTVGSSTLSTFPTGYSSIAIPLFENSTFERDIEFELADALIKEIEARTPYKVTRRGSADTVLSGRIAKIERDQISKSKFTGQSRPPPRRDDQNVTAC